MNEERMKLNIEKAQTEIDARKDVVAQGRMRQHYHFMPQTGWMNDPNGLIFFKGKYHIFYQHNPYSAFWSCMHWGHAISDDMIHWEFLPIALAPSEACDDHPQGGCFSGSAVEYDGKLYLLYTSSTNFGNGMEQMQCLACSDDGIHFEKYEGNPVLTAPKDITRGEFRDPKVWKHGETFYMVLGASRNGRGEALLYSSPDLVHWDFVNVLAESRGEWGSMWECPDFFRIGDQYVLTFSPVGSGDHTSVFLVGDFDYRTGKFDYVSGSEMDWGLDYYAPQSFLAPDGRRIVVTWANGWQWMPGWKDWGPTYQEGWCGFFNLPREVHALDDGTIQFVPIRELAALRSGYRHQEELTVENRKVQLEAGDGVCYELKFFIDLERTDADCLQIDFRAGNGHSAVCRFDFKKGEMTVDRSAADGWGKGVSRSVLRLHHKKNLDVHVFSDQSSLEIFTDHYRNNHSNNIFAGDEQSGIILRSFGGRTVLRQIDSYGMEKVF